MIHLFRTIILITSILTFSCHSSRKQQKQSKPEEKSTLIRECPDAWYRNLMPGPDKTQPEEYLVVKGSRVEIASYDTVWIRKNCTIKGATEVH